MKQPRYSDKELMEFRDLIILKIDKANEELQIFKASLNKTDNNGTDDTYAGQKSFDDGSETLEQETSNLLAEKQEKFITGLRNALVRIENKTYGICRVSGELIPKERLLAVPHATLTITAKKNQ